MSCRLALGKAVVAAAERTVVVAAVVVMAVMAGVEVGATHLQRLAAARFVRQWACESGHREEENGWCDDSSSHYTRARALLDACCLVGARSRLPT